MQEKNMGKIENLAKGGYGFISIEGRDNDLFFHRSELVNANFSDLNVGDKVIFKSIEDTPKGDIAKVVEVIK